MNSIPLEKKVLSYIQAQHLIAPGQKILLAVSGGVDSMVLLYLFHQLKGILSIQIHAGHVNHGLRKEALQDQIFVEKQCQSLNIPISSKVYKTPKITSAVEEKARQMRFSALLDMAKKTNCDGIALAHHQDDLAETVLMRILRGTGLQGLQAILPKRHISGYSFIRPFLKLTRQDILSYAKEKHIRYRNDHTNDTLKFTRNRIRHNLLPLLKKEYQNNIQEILANLAITAGGDYEYLQEQAQKIMTQIIKPSKSKNLLKFKLALFKDLPVSMRRLILRAGIYQLLGHTRQISLSHLLEIEDLLENRKTQSQAHLPLGIRITKNEEHIILTKTAVQNKK